MRVRKQKEKAPGKCKSTWDLNFGLSKVFFSLWWTQRKTYSHQTLHRQTPHNYHHTRTNIHAHAHAVMWSFVGTHELYIILFVVL